MRDDFLSQNWAEHHGRLSTFLGDLLDQTRIAFERLVARAYDAPWRTDVRCARDPARATRDMCT